MKVTFWGVRGSIAAPGRTTAEFGGNTSCVEIRAGDDLFIMDAGTGIRELGRHLLAAGEPIRGTMLLSHSHWDHIQGFPFFGPLLVPGHSFTILGPQEHSERLNVTLAGQMQYQYFPIGLDQLAAQISYQELREETFRVGTATITTHYLNHTSMALAYRIESMGHSVVYATDTEPFSQTPRAWANNQSRKFLHKQDEELAEFFRGADVLIIDSQYTDHEYPSRIGWGHGTPDYALDLAISAGVGTLALFHHDPTRIDTAVSVLEQLAQKRVQRDGADLEVLCASEGLTLAMDDLDGDGRPVPERSIPQFTPRVRIAIVGAREDFMRTAWKALAQDHYQVIAVNDASPAGRQQMADFQPHLVLMEYGLEGWDPKAAQAIMEHEAKRNVPVLTVIPIGRYEYAQEAFEAGAADVVIEPFAASQLRSRVDSWLMRTGVAVDRRIRGRRDTAPTA
ncbi:MAG: hypothetical protein JO247_01885 [Chloroflexi bacterium]|nr:hypothetical protein [Chloroflexota bacterium]